MPSEAELWRLRALDSEREAEALRAERDGYLKRLDECVVRAQWNEVRAIEAEAEVKTLREARAEVDDEAEAALELLADFLPVGRDAGLLRSNVIAAIQRVRDALAAADTPPEQTRTKVLRAEVKTLREALGEDLAGRPFADLLTEAAAVMRGMGGGPLADCLAAKAEDVRAALAADTPEAT